MEVDGHEKYSSSSLLGAEKRILFVSGNIVTGRRREPEARDERRAERWTSREQIHESREAERQNEEQVLR
jgi:hypothetical protein